MFHQIETQRDVMFSRTRRRTIYIWFLGKMSGVKHTHTHTHTLIQKPVYNLNTLLFPQLYQVGIMSGNQTRPKCFDTSQ